MLCQLVVGYRVEHLFVFVVVFLMLLRDYACKVGPNFLCFVFQILDIFKLWWELINDRSELINERISLSLSLYIYIYIYIYTGI